MKLNRWTRCLAPFVLFTALALVPATARAQAPDPAAPQGEEGGGRVFDGYFVAGLFAFAAMFAVAKTARRG